MAHLQAVNYGQLPSVSSQSANLNDFKELILKAISYSSISWSVAPRSACKDSASRPSALLDGIARTIAIGGGLNHTVSIEFAHWEERQARQITDRVTVMSAFRKDLFVSVTLPILIAAVGASAVGWGAYTHIDSKLDSAKTEASSSIDHLGDTLRQELRADREARAKEFNTLRLEMREDRKEASEAIRVILDRS